jgi:hypothetical protein
MVLEYKHINHKIKYNQENLSQHVLEPAIINGTNNEIIG